MTISILEWSAALTFVAGVLAAGCGTSVIGGQASTSSAGGTGGTNTTSGTGGTGGCTTAADCPGIDTECVTRTCTGGACGVDLAPAGFVAGTQTSGDCQKVVCDGNGAIIAVADDTDVPSDGNACTLDLCTSGMPSHAPAPAGTACGPGGLTCDGAGVCVGCLVDADCGASTACAAYTCDAMSGLCAVTYVPSGQGDPGGQMAGDCKRVVCSGSGGTLLIDDDTDVPDDGNPCTADGCALGQPTHAPVSAGTPCGNGLECDGQGACQACLADADCGAPTPCATPACAGGTCVTTFVPSGQGDPGGQANGDCKKVVCNGSGGTLSIADDSDVPDDGNPCTADACAGGVASHTLVPAGTTCGVDLVCDGAGICVGCVTDADCGPSTVCATHHCQAGVCVTENTPSGTGDPGGQVTGDCKKVVCNGSGGTTTVPDDSDVENDGIPCTIDQCSGGVAQHLPGGCGSGCLIGGTFYAADTVNPANACQVCDPSASTSAWSNRADTTACDDGNPCTKNDQCQSGACGGTAGTCAPTSCRTVSACDGNGGCAITNKPDGTLCPDGAPLNLPGVCYNGWCQLGCFINGSFLMPGWTASNICLACDTTQSRTTWSYNYPLECNDGNPCTYHDRCHTGVCWGEIAASPGTPCPNDGNACTSDVCDGLGTCKHPQAPNGTSCGSGLVCVDGGCVAGP